MLCFIDWFVCCFDLRCVELDWIFGVECLCIAFGVLL